MLDPAFKLPPRADVKPSARPLLTPEMRSVLPLYLELIERHALENSVPLGRTEVSGFHDPEDGSEQLVVAQWVGLPAEAAMDYWEELGKEVEAWTNSLPPALAELAAEWIALEVYSDVDDVAA